MHNSDKFILVSILLALGINVASTFLGTEYPNVGIYVTIILGAAIIAWAMYRLGDAILRYARYGRYATTVMFLSRKNELLLIMHPYHHRLLPIGSRLNLWELPHKAVPRVLGEEAGIKEKDFEFHPVFHASELAINDTVEQVPRPFHVQIEGRRQRDFIRFHYDMIYVCRFKDEDKPVASDMYLKPRWASLDELRHMDRSKRPFDDAISLYQKLLEELERRSR